MTTVNIMEGTCFICLDSPATSLGNGDYENNFCDLVSVFVLRKVLDFVRTDCEDLLQETGLNPGQWLAVCSSCSEMMRVALKLHHQIAGLEQELKWLKTEVKTKLKTSWREGGGSGGVGSVHEFVRRKFWQKNHTVGSAKGKSESGEFEKEDDLGDCDPLSPQIQQLRPLSPSSDSSCDEEKEREKISETEERDELAPSPTGSFEGICDNSSDSQADEKKPRKQKRQKQNISRSADTRNRDSDKMLKNEDIDEDDDSIQELFSNDNLAGPNRPVTRVSKKNPQPRQNVKKYKTKSNLTCDECNHRSRTRDEYRRHKRRHLVAKFSDEVEGGIKVECKLCAKRFFASGAIRHMIDHLKKEHSAESGLEPFQCHLCVKTFIVKGHLTEHVKLFHEGLKRFKCDRCGAEFRARRSFELHMGKHDDSLSLQEVCDICGLVFSSKRGLLQHSRNFHPDGGGTVRDREVECKVCGIPVVHAKALKLHLKTAHRDLYKFECDQCDAIYMKGPSLKIHMERSHLGRKGVCQYCQAEVGHPCYLQAHWKKRCKMYPGREGAVPQSAPEFVTKEAS